MKAAWVTRRARGRGALRLALLLSAALLAGTPAPADPAEATALAERFCALQATGDDAALRAMLTRDLDAALAEAEERNAVLAESMPDEKPPLGDGIPWRSFPEVAESCAPETVRESANATLVEIRYRIAGEDAGWKDTLVLRPEQGGLPSTTCCSTCSRPTPTRRASGAF